LRIHALAKKLVKQEEARRDKGKANKQKKGEKQAVGQAQLRCQQ
jgi:hypothetical protein